jgi:hypothetical protein
MNWKQFEELARSTMSKFLGVTLSEKRIGAFPKKFDMVSQDGRLVGDAKFLTLVHGTDLPPAKFMEIAGHVWLLEKIPAERRFLAFGNQRKVPVWWLRKYGELVRDVEFYFIDEKANVEQLKYPAGSSSLTRCCSR